jgi:hypothetical protein
LKGQKRPSDGPGRPGSPSPDYLQLHWKFEVAEEWGIPDKNPGLLPARPEGLENFDSEHWQRLLVAGVEQPEPQAPGARRCVDDELEEPVFIRVVHSAHSDPEMIVLQTLPYLLCARSGLRLPLRLPERLPPTASATSLAVRVLCDAFVARVRAARLLWPARHY